ncbi:SAGA-associated factor 11 homolog [Nilaparvata lugens]|uniref:SAGA-associated factor 11 homolog n=1 Tax=Nilaparvata lugens TaxID=108931 RepID=UPI000B98B14E|nr:SAGA-associated factor 11 homolog [Nilaparvata lugens]
MDRNVKDSTSKVDNVDVAASKAVDILIEKAILGEVFDFHRAVKLGVIDEKAEREDGSVHESVEGYNVDVFGQQFKAPVCSCPFCDRMMGAGRLMGHFEKCAARRGGQSGQGAKSRKVYSEAVSEDDNDDDYDWVAGNEQAKMARKKRDRNKAKSSRAANKHSPVKDVAVVLDANIFEQLQQAGDGDKRIAKDRYRRKQRKLR